MKKHSKGAFHINDDKIRGSSEFGNSFLIAWADQFKDLQIEELYHR